MKSASGNAAAQTSKARAGRSEKKVVLLSGGNPQIAMGDGDGPVQAYIAAMPGWKRGLGEKLDALIERRIPGVIKAVKWNSPFYGRAENGWLVSFHVFTRYVKLCFFNGAALKPPVPGGKSPDARWIDIHEGEWPEVQLSAWMKQCVSLPGWSAGFPSADKRAKRKSP